MQSQVPQFVPTSAPAVAPTVRPARCLKGWNCNNRSTCPHAHCSAHYTPRLCYHSDNKRHDWSTCNYAHAIASRPVPAVASRPTPAVASTPAPAVASTPAPGTYAAAIFKSSYSRRIPDTPAVASRPAPVAVASPPAPVAVASPPAPVAIASPPAPVAAPVVAKTRKLEPVHRHTTDSLWYGQCNVCGFTRSDMRNKAFVDPDCDPEPGDSAKVLHLKAKLQKFLQEKRDNLYIPEFQSFEYTPNGASYFTITSTVCHECKSDFKKLQKDYVDDHMSKYPPELERFQPKTKEDYFKQPRIKVYSVGEAKEYDDGLIEWAVPHDKPGHVFVRYGFHSEKVRSADREKWISVEEILRLNPPQ